ncbi:PMS1 protein homolog 1 isoform X2 [Megalops cyprinoides]|uniref:PMS1 protein homolog 1 isoform X2 n=1 Tax=Megalops cyprinoides TaxID=118141 RepID=UPI0018643F86|nr:PMS1 protein homolog 1 isoform X2 [Megalops cyprinoides]
MKALSAETIRLLSSSQVITSVVNVVKELLENSLDAGASSVEVKLENYGLDRIEVRDNGSGIKASDAPVMAVRHYTSKISSHEDLEHLETYGFRGEALGSICAVSEVVLTTKTVDEDISTQYTLDLTGKIVSQKPSHLGQGTTVCVLKLFKNLPVRRQFYSNTRKCKDELKKVQDLLMAYAIIKPELRLTYTHNKITIDGYFPKAGSDVAATSSSSSDRTFIFVNNRPVHHKDILKVVKEQYSSQYAKDSAHGHYPTLMMSITVPASSVDVNLTPDKTQVMLQNKEAVLSAVQAMLATLYGPQASVDSAAPDGTDSHVSHTDAEPSLQGSTLDGLGDGLGVEGPLTYNKTAPLDESSQPRTPEPSSEVHREPGGESESSLNRTANTSSSSSSEDWINKSFSEFEQNSSMVKEDGDLSSSVVMDCTPPKSPDGLVQGDEMLEVPADSWSKGWAFRDPVTGGHLEPVKIHVPAEHPGEADADTQKSPGQKKALNAVTEKMSKATAYDLISSCAIRQPMSASAIFQQETRPTILQENPKASLQEVAVAMEEKWKNLKEEDRQKYEERAERDLNRYSLQSRQASERGAGTRESGKQPQGLKRKAPLSNQMILDQLFSSQPPRKKSPVKPSRPLPFSVAALRRRLSLPSYGSGPEALSLVNRLPSHSSWVVTCGGKLSLLNPSRVEEALLLNQLLEDKVLPAVQLETPILLTESVLGGAEYTSVLCNMERGNPDPGGVTCFSDPRLLWNGFQIRLTPESPSTERRLEVAGIADCVPFLGVTDLKEILTAVIKRNATSVRECRPLKVVNYLEGEAVRLTRQLPLSLSRDAMKDVLSRMKQQLGDDCRTCIHGRPFFHHLTEVPETEQDALRIMSSSH